MFYSLLLVLEQNGKGKKPPHSFCAGTDITSYCLWWLGIIIMIARRRKKTSFLGCFGFFLVYKMNLIGDIIDL